MPDDEEGRFFGGGVTRDTTSALDFIDQREKDGVAVIENLGPNLHTETD